MSKFYCIVHGKFEVAERVKKGETLVVGPVLHPFMQCDYRFTNLDTRCNIIVKMCISEGKPLPKGDDCEETGPNLEEIRSREWFW